MYMANMKIKILTDARVKRRSEGVELHSFVGVNSDSKIFSISCDAELAATLSEGKLRILTNCRVNPKGVDSVFVDTQAVTKVRSHFLF